MPPTATATVSAARQLHEPDRATSPAEVVDALNAIDQDDDGMDLYHFAEEESIDWEAEADQTLAMLYESEAITL